jgi:hypothetical protein
VEGVATVLSIALTREQIPFRDLIARRVCSDRSAGVIRNTLIWLTKAETSENLLIKDVGLEFGRS